MKRSIRQRASHAARNAHATAPTNDEDVHASPPTKRPNSNKNAAADPIEAFPAEEGHETPVDEESHVVVVASPTATPTRIGKGATKNFPDGYKATILNPSSRWQRTSSSHTPTVTSAFVSSTTAAGGNSGATQYYYEEADAQNVTEQSYEVAESEEGSSSHVIVKSDLNDDSVEEIVVDDSTDALRKGRKSRRRVPGSQIQLTGIEQPKNTEVETAPESGEVYTFEVVEGTDGETIVVDDEGQPTDYNLYEEAYPEESNSLYMLGGEIAKHPWTSNEEINHFFMANPSLSTQIDVRELTALTKTVSPEGNFQLIIGLAALVNVLKRDIASLKTEVTSLREIVTSKQDLGNTKRRFSTHNDVRHPWRIAPMPPLREVDLVATAHTMDFTRGTKKSLTNKDSINRFVKTVLELLIPEEFARQYTVRERSQRRNGLKDIGEHAKNQIVGCVLDLLGLYDINGLTDQDRGDRVHFTNVVNHAMRMALIDLRRSEPRRILGPEFLAQNNFAE